MHAAVSHSHMPWHWLLGRRDQHLALHFPFSLAGKDNEVTPQPHSPQTTQTLCPLLLLLGTCLPAFSPPKELIVSLC